jgi:hypothetical protein
VHLLLACIGFSNANQTWLPVNPNYKTLNVESQLDEKWSHIKVYKLLIEARKTEAIMNGGLDIHILEDSVLVYTRYGTTVKYVMVLQSGQQNGTLHMIKFLNKRKCKGAHQ